MLLSHPPLRELAVPVGKLKENFKTFPFLKVPSPGKLQLLLSLCQGMLSQVLPFRAQERPQVWGCPPRALVHRKTSAAALNSQTRDTSAGIPGVERWGLSRISEGSKVWNSRGIGRHFETRENRQLIDSPMARLGYCLCICLWSKAVQHWGTELSFFVLEGCSPALPAMLDDHKYHGDMAEDYRLYWGKSWGLSAICFCLPLHTGVW